MSIGGKRFGVIIDRRGGRGGGDRRRDILRIETGKPATVEMGGGIARAAIGAFMVTNVHCIYSTIGKGRLAPPLWLVGGERFGVGGDQLCKGADIFQRGRVNGRFTLCD